MKVGLFRACFTHRSVDIGLIGSPLQALLALEELGDGAPDHSIFLKIGKKIDALERPDICVVSGSAKTALAIAFLILASWLRIVRVGKVLIGDMRLPHSMLLMAIPAERIILDDGNFAILVEAANGDFRGECGLFCSQKCWIRYFPNLARRFFLSSRRVFFHRSCIEYAQKNGPSPAVEIDVSGKISIIVGNDLAAANYMTLADYRMVLERLLDRLSSSGWAIIYVPHRWEIDSIDDLLEKYHVRKIDMRGAIVEQLAFRVEAAEPLFVSLASGALATVLIANSVARSVFVDVSALLLDTSSRRRYELLRTAVETRLRREGPASSERLRVQPFESIEF